MRTMTDQMHHDFAGERGDEPAEPQDVTLGMGALLGIFFAIVLVCAVFFGFGYSTGRTLHGSNSAAGPASGPAAPPVNGPVVSQSVPSASAPRPDAILAASSQDAAAQPTPLAATPSLAGAQPAAKPLPGSTLAPAEIEQGAAPADDSGAWPPGEAPAETRARAAVRRQQPAIAGAPAPTSLPSPAGAVAGGIAAGIPGGIMVQIAAVVHQPDAETLAQALRKDGYNAVVRTEPEDRFLHVQIGPFATRDQARAMRARLAANGYNAFLRP